MKAYNDEPEHEDPDKINPKLTEWKSNVSKANNRFGFALTNEQAYRWYEEAEVPQEAPKKGLQLPSRKNGAPRWLKKLHEQVLQEEGTQDEQETEEDKNEFVVAEEGQADEVARNFAELDPFIVPEQHKRSTRFVDLTRNRGVPHKHIALYQEWLLGLEDEKGVKRFKEEDIPIGRGKTLKAGLKIPAPYGKAWRELQARKGKRETKKYDVFIANRIMEELEEEQYLKVKNAYMVADAGIGEKKVHLNEVQKERLGDYDNKSRSNEDIKIVKANAVKKKAFKKKKAPKTDDKGKPPPRTIEQALTQEDVTEAYLWLDSINKEFDGFGIIFPANWFYSKKFKMSNIFPV